MKTVVCDLEANGLNPDKIWCVVCKEYPSGEIHVFRDPGSFNSYAIHVHTWVGHNFISYDCPVLKHLYGSEIEYTRIKDTLVLSRMVDYSIPGGHSLEAWGDRLGIKKKYADVDQSFYDQWSQELEDRCISDCEINYKLYQHFLRYIQSPRWQEAIETEHEMAVVCQEIHDNGFYFDIDKAKELWHTITREVDVLDDELQTAYPPQSRLIREIHPRRTAHGSLHRGDFRWVKDGNLTEFNGYPFSRICFEPFNPGSPKQTVQRLNAEGWRPFEKTKGHKEAEKELRRIARSKRPQDKQRAEELRAKMPRFKELGWTISEPNINTLPATASPAAKKLVRRALLAGRKSDLEEWINLYNPETHAIHGTINSIGAWTMRMSHTAPNLGNIPASDPSQPDKTPYSDDMRSCFGVSEDEWLIGVDAEGIQLRVLAHYINDDRFTYSVTFGNSKDGTDPHSLNWKALGKPCKSRQDAKTFIYAWLLGAGVGKVASILNCSNAEAEYANQSFIEFYPGLKLLKETIIPRDASRGYFEAFDGRYVRIKGQDEGTRRHLTLAGYLQTGETVIMRKGNRIWRANNELRDLRERRLLLQRNFVHDEWQSSLRGSYELALHVARIQAASIGTAGEFYGLRCPMAGSILGKRKDGDGKPLIAIGKTWAETH